MLNPEDFAPPGATQELFKSRYSIVAPRDLPGVKLPSPRSRHVTLSLQYLSDHNEFPPTRLGQTHRLRAFHGRA